MSAPPESNGDTVNQTEEDMKLNRINIKVGDDTGNQVIFKLKRTTPLEKLMVAYAQQQSKAPDALRFFFDSIRILKDHTIESLEMEEDDVINVNIEQTGGMDEPRTSVPSIDKSEPVGALKHISLLVRDQNNEVAFKIKRNTLLSKLTHAYAQQQQVDPKSLRFVAADGVRINPEDTPESIEMEDDDVIDCFQEQIGGTDQHEAPVSLNLMPEEADVPKHITLKVRDQSGNQISYKIKRFTPLLKLMTTYATGQNVALNSLRFMFDGTRIQNDDSPAGLEMAESDCIDVFQEQIGGLGA